MAFTYYPPVILTEVPAEHWPKGYYVQLTPDRKHLVLGILHHGHHRPSGDTWLDVGKIDRDFPKRYFVRYIDQHRLVPGSLIEDKQLPEGQWKEVKPVEMEVISTPDESIGRFHRVVFSDDIYMIIGPGNFVSSSSFINNKVIPVLQVARPDINLASEVVSMRLFSFKGDFEELDKDVSKLVAFSGAAPLRLASANPAIANNNLLRTNQLISINLATTGIATGGVYSIIYGLEVSSVITDYIVLENILVRS